MEVRASVAPGVSIQDGPMTTAVRPPLLDLAINLRRGLLIISELSKGISRDHVNAVPCLFEHSFHVCVKLSIFRKGSLRLMEAVKDSDFI